MAGEFDFWYVPVMIKKAIVLSLLICVFAFQSQSEELPQPTPKPPVSQDPPKPQPPPKPEQPNDFVPAGEIIPTIYYKPTLEVDNSKCAAEELQDILDVEGKVIVRVCPRILRICAVEGACVLKVDGKEMSLTYMQKIDGTYRFKETTRDRCPFGYGVKNICADPFFSVAADLTIYKPGDVIFIPELMGVKLLNDEYHNGFFIVRDSGGNIKGESRFDFFTGFIPYGDDNNPFSVLRLDVKSTRMPYFRVLGRTADLVKRSRLYPHIPKRSWPPEKTN